MDGLGWIARKISHLPYTTPRLQCMKNVILIPKNIQLVHRNKNMLETRHE